MRQHPGSWRVQASACASAFYICHGRDARALGRKRRAHRAGMTDHAARALRQHPGNIQTVRWACRLLRTLCGAGAGWAGRTRRQAAARACALPALVHAMAEHAHSESLLLDACDAAADLIGQGDWLDDAPGRAALALRAGVGDRVTAAMARHPTDDDLQVVACKLLDRLILNAELYCWRLPPPSLIPPHWPTFVAAQQLTELAPRAEGALVHALLELHPPSPEVRRAANDLSYALFLRNALACARFFLTRLDDLLWLEAVARILGILLTGGLRPAAWAIVRVVEGALRVMLRVMQGAPLEVMSKSPALATIIKHAAGGSSWLVPPNDHNLDFFLLWPVFLFGLLYVSCSGRAGHDYYYAVCRVAGWCLRVLVREVVLFNLRIKDVIVVGPGVGLVGPSLELDLDELACFAAEPGTRCTAWSMLRLLRASEYVHWGALLLLVLCTARSWAPAGSVVMVLAPPVCAA